MEQIPGEEDDALEDAEDIAIAEARMNDPDDGVVPWEEVKAEAGLAATGACEATRTRVCHSTNEEPERTA